MTSYNVVYCSHYTISYIINCGPVEYAPLAFSSSRESASVLVATIHGIGDFHLTDRLDHQARIYCEVAGRRDDYIQSVLTSVLGTSPPLTCCTVRRAIDFRHQVG